MRKRLVSVLIVYPKGPPELKVEIGPRVFTLHAAVHIDC